MTTASPRDPSHATGTITVRKYEPSPYDQPSEGPALVRIHVEEDFSGDIEGTGVAEFLQAQVSEDAASFVGIERVSGSIAGRTGTFVLQDQGTLTGPASPAGGPSCPAQGLASSLDCVVTEASPRSSARAPTSPLTTGSNSAGTASRP
jgi:hypothetical protein